jgi:hypothetical protein
MGFVVSCWSEEFNLTNVLREREGRLVSVICYLAFGLLQRMVRVGMG